MTDIATGMGEAFFGFPEQFKKRAYEFTSDAMIATLLSEKEETAGLLLFGGAATSMKDALLYQNYLAAEEFANKKS